jgi:hypothetical protein
MAGNRASRDEWQKRVDRWKDSGLTAKEFAAETGINAGTLQFWSYLETYRPPEKGWRSTKASAVAFVYVDASGRVLPPPHGPRVEIPLSAFGQ